MRTWVAAGVGVAMSWSIPLAAQECRENQRWLLVTVLETRVLDPNTFELQGTETTLRGSRLVDICRIEGINATADDPPSGVIELKRGSARDSFMLLVVRESPKQICSVLPGCSDATR